tara:strand:- start:2110 stop:2379 length:270 start_codon:yes stop_codon:yes gene_type:complete
MTHKIVEEPIILRYDYDITGKKIPVYSAKVETTLTNTITGNTYQSEEEMQSDIDNAETAVTEADVRRDVLVTAPLMLCGADILDEDKKD